MVTLWKSKRKKIENSLRTLVVDQERDIGLRNRENIILSRLGINLLTSTLNSPVNVLF